MATKLRIILVTLAFSTLTSCSCASKDELARVQSETQDAKRIAEEALSNAKDARVAADDASSRSRRSEEALNRGFKKSMYK